MVFRALMQGWLRNAAQEKIRAKVMEAARGQMAGKEAEAEGAEREGFAPFQIGFVFALGDEAGSLEDAVKDGVGLKGHGFTAKLGTLAGRRVAVLRSGAGREAARHATRAMIVGHKPAWVISAGFCGGLDAKLARYDILMANELADESGRRLQLDLKVDPAALAQTPHVHVGRLVTVDQIVRLPEEKLALGRKHQALAVDMESFAVAEVCREEKVRFLAVRIVSDPVDEPLPPDVQNLVDQPSRTAQVGAALGAIWRRPSSVKDMVRLKEQAIVASDRLAKFLVSMLDTVAPK